MKKSWFALTPTARLDPPRRAPVGDTTSPETRDQLLEGDHLPPRVEEGTRMTVFTPVARQASTPSRTPLRCRTA